MNPSALKRFAAPERNVGGGDMATRLMACLLLLILTAVVLPQTDLPYPLTKIALLIVSELGLVGLMLGMFLKSKTYFFGFQLFIGSLAMLWLAGQHHAYAAAGVGLVFVGFGVSELVTRRSRLNALLGLSSYRAVQAKATLLEEALQPEANDAPAVPLNPVVDGAAK